MKLRDSLTGELKEVVPGADGVIGIYVCGSTVYGRIHVGNARPYVVFQLMRRYLEWVGGPARLVENITDVDDKIIIAARERGIGSAQLAREMTDFYVADTDRLGLGRPDEEPRATETIAEIIALIGELIERGHAYEAGGDVYFAVRAYPAYGALSNQRPDELESSGRIEPGEHKRDSAGLCPVEGAETRRGHRLGLALGEGQAGLAHRVLGDGREVPRAASLRCTAAAAT